MLNFCEIEEIKERYVENSEFVVFFYGFLEEIMRKVKKKVVVMNFFFYFQQQYLFKYLKYLKFLFRDSFLSFKDIIERYNGYIDYFSYKILEVYQYQYEYLYF